MAPVRKVQTLSSLLVALALLVYGHVPFVAATGMVAWAQLAPARAAQYFNFDSDFYYDPGSPCEFSVCNPYWYSPSEDYYFDPGSPCDASICGEG